jgi:hypothetical protein
MSWKTTTITLIFAIALVLAAAMTSGVERESRSSSGGAAPMLSADQFPIDSIQRVTLARKGELRHVFERSPDGAWSQIEPFLYPMDAFSMRQLAAAAREVKVVDRLTTADLRDGLTRATLGLDPAEAVVTYEWPGRSMSVSLGRRGIAGRAYVRIDDNPDVLIVSQELHQRAVEMSPKEWRDRVLLRNVGVDCDRIVREDGTTRLVLERDRRMWRMIEPARTRVDRDALDRYMQVLGGARAGGFLVDQPAADSLGRFGLAPGTAAGSIDVTCTSTVAEGDEVVRSPVRQTVFVGNPAGAGTNDRFAMVEDRPTIVRLPAAALQGLFIRAEELIDPTGSGAVAADVKSVRIAGTHGEIRFERDLERWIAPDHNRREVAAAVVADLLSKLTEVRAPAIEIREYPRELEKAVVTLYGFDGRPIDTIRIAYHEKSGQWALENGDNVLRVFTRGLQIPLSHEEYGLRRE